MKKLGLFIIGILVLGLVAMAGVAFFEKNPTEVFSCLMDAKLCPDGTAVGRSGPRCEFAPCPSPVLAENENIRVTTPETGAVIESPLSVRGEARGNWYFEASFPMRLLDGNGNEVARATVQAKGDWMTTDWVPFEATLSFPMMTTPTGTLVLEKDNPSGLPENAAELRIPIRFAPGS